MTVMIRTLKGWLLICLYLAPALALAQDAKQALMQFNESVQKASGRFSQTVISAQGHVKQQGEGRFLFAKPGLFRWETTEPFPQLIVSDGESVTTYDPDLEQASKRSATVALQSSPSALLFGHSDLDKLFNIVPTTSDAADGLDWLEAIPLKPDSLFERIQIGLREKLPAQVLIHDSLGQVTRLGFYDWNVDPDVNEGSFYFTPPEGVDMIEVQ